MNNNTSASHSQKDHYEESLENGVFVRESLVTLFAKLFVAIITMSVLEFALSIVPASGQSGFLSILFFGVRILEFLIVLFLILMWFSCHYRITPEKIEGQRGFFFRRYRYYAMKNIEAAKMQQTIIGRIFNFGTIKLEAPTLNKTIRMPIIHDPLPVLRPIEHYMPNTKPKNLDNNDLLVVS